jgi:hypothetical protein
MIKILIFGGFSIMEMIIDFPGGARVDAHFGSYTVKTDQPPMGGGSGSAPTPFAVFLASVGACAGIYVLGFCNQRGLSTDGIRIVQLKSSCPQLSQKNIALPWSARLNSALLKSILSSRQHLIFIPKKLKWLKKSS